MENSQDTDIFKTVFKKLKSRNPPADYTEVLDFFNSDNTNNTSEGNTSSVCCLCNDLGLRHHSLWKVFTIDSVPGLKFISNPFTGAGQRHWIKQCLENYPLHPNVTNLSDNMVSRNLWESYFNGNPNGKTDLWKLRWATLGYHHNWNTKIYSESNYSPFPPCLSKLTKHTGNILGFDINPQAAIINYYHLDSTLSGHTDHSELDLSAPLLSFSFGRKAIFMIGGKDKDVYPQSMFVRSGDVIVMSGLSRLCYHAVPKIFVKESVDEDIWNEGCIPSIYDTYLNESRINMNVRQVLPS